MIRYFPSTTSASLGKVSMRVRLLAFSLSRCTFFVTFCYPSYHLSWLECFLRPGDGPRRPGGSSWQIGTCARGSIAGNSRPLARSPGSVPILPGGQDNARRQPLHIPFPGTLERLVEIVDIEDRFAFWSGIDTEILDRHHHRAAPGSRRRASLPGRMP